MNPFELPYVVKIYNATYPCGLDTKEVFTFRHLPNPDNSAYEALESNAECPLKCSAKLSFTVQETQAEKETETELEAETETDIETETETQTETESDLVTNICCSKADERRRLMSLCQG